MQNFKVGDWVKTIDGTVIKLDWVDKPGVLSNLYDYGIFGKDNCKLSYQNEVTIWQPTEGEWCWYSKWDRIVCVEFYLCKFVLDMNEVEPEFKHKYEPFIGQLPSFLKDNT